MEANITREGWALEQVRVTDIIRGLYKIYIILSKFKSYSRILIKMKKFRKGISKHFGKHLKGQKKGSW